MAAPVRLGRKRPLPVCPNPLFVRWLTEWRDEAASRGRRTQFVFQKALRSLRRYPLPLRSGKEAKILQHFGDGLCRMLDQRLQQHKASVGDHAPCSPSGTKSPARERPPAEVQDPSMPARPSPNPLCSLLTFSDFNAGAMKNKAQCVRDVFARQLMQVRGVSGEKAAALVARYSSPASLLAAYDACATPKEQEMLLSTIKCGPLQRNLGPVLSRTLSQLYCSCGPLT
uniref:Crossover junction endonuclease MUS81 n=1 Tax=Bos taurus TaxID=9913 RepID=F6Q225_BOVIN